MARIPGVTPAAIAIVNVYIEMRRRESAEQGGRPAASEPARPVAVLTEEPPPSSEYAG